MIELDFADINALSHVDASEFEHRRPRNGKKRRKKDRAREREEIESSWYVLGNIARNVDAGLSPAVLGRP